MTGRWHIASLVIRACIALCAAACGDDSGGSDAQRGDAGGQTDGVSSGGTCGGIAGLSCAAGLFCNYEEDAGGLGCDGSVADSSGVCQPVPQVCDSQSAPVCGCDRRTYDSACAAHRTGASVLREDRCTEIDCEAIGGRVTLGAGPPPRCEDLETDYGNIRFSSGAMAIEGAKCCVGG
jgi:hypothetical protein